MKKLILFLLFSSSLFAQTPVINRSWDLKITSTTNQCSDDTTKTCSPPENIANRGLGAHIFIWSLQSGVMSSCTLSFQTSPNNSSTATWTEQATGDCTSSGTSSYLIFTANFIRVKAKVFNVQSGMALVTVNYAGYTIPPTTIATITTAPLTNQNINNRRYPQNFSGANAGAKLIACIADLPSTGGTCDGTGFEGAQTATSQILITKSNVTILFGCSTWTLSGVSPTQSPFVAANFQVTATNVWFIGQGPNCSKLKLGAGSTSDIFVFGKSTTSGGVIGGGVIGFELDGNKTNNTSGTDDTFQSGIQIINTTAAGATQDSNVTIKNNSIHAFNHYGIVTYGEYANSNYIQENRIYDNGKNDTYGTGDGVYINYSSSNNHIENNFIYLNQRSGLRFSSAGRNQTGNQVRNNTIFSNSIHGIYLDEEMGLGSISGQGQYGIIIEHNTIYSQTLSGITAATADSVGIVSDFTIANNTIYSNGTAGILSSGNNDATNRTQFGKINGNSVYNNGTYGIRMAPTLFGMTVGVNNVHDNPSGNFSDVGGNLSTNICNRASPTDQTCNIGAIASTGDVSGTSITALTGSGTTAAVTLNQSGVANWHIDNNATTGVLALNQGGSDRFTFDTSGNATIQTKLTVGTSIRSGNTIFSSLPTCNAGAEGMTYVVTDSNTVVFNANIAGGSSSVVIGFCNGTNWTVH